MYNDNLTVKSASEPDFQRLICVLRDEITKSAEIAKMINGSASVLKSFPPNGKDQEKRPLNEADGIIGAFWQEIERIREINCMNEYNLSHLRSIIGN